MWKSGEQDVQLVLFSSRFCRPSCAITQPKRTRHLKRPSPYTITNARRVACNNAHLNAPILLRNMFVSVNMEFFCRINIKPRNALPVMLDCSQYGTSRFKQYRRCHSLCVQRVIAESVGVKPLILYSVGIIACSLASVRVTSSVCQPVQGSRIDVIVW